MPSYFWAFPKVSDRDGRIRVMADWLHTSWDSHTTWDERLLDPLAKSIVAEFLRLASLREDPFVARIRDLMRSRLAESLTLDALAAHAGMSKYHFLRRYKAATGCPPMRDLRMMRLRKARDLLLTTDDTLCKIAMDTGFCDEYHLSHLFREKLGASPGEVRGKRA